MKFRKKRRPVMRRITLRIIAVALFVAMMALATSPCGFELETYGPYPPMQDPETYNLTQVIQQIKNQHSASHAGE
jgi:hypothetical protein